MAAGVNLQFRSSTMLKTTKFRCVQSEQALEGVVTSVALGLRPSINANGMCVALGLRPSINTTVGANLHRREVCDHAVSHHSALLS